MKFQSNRLLESLTENEIRNLTSEVKETLATDAVNEKKKVFSSAQLWDIYRRRKNTFGKRLY
jgi:hypothetical protein